MNPRTVVIAGATGFIGSYFHRRFLEEGWKVRTVGRNASADAQWNDDGAITLTTPEDTRPGDNRLVVHTSGDELLGWDRLKVVGPPR